MNWFNALKIIGPLVLGTVPGAAKYSGVILEGIALAENSKKPGADKKQIVLDSVKVAGETVNTAKGKNVFNVDKMVSTAAELVDLVVTATNALSKKQ